MQTLYLFLFNHVHFTSLPSISSLTHVKLEKNSSEIKKRFFMISKEITKTVRSGNENIFQLQETNVKF